MKFRVQIDSPDAAVSSGVWADTVIMEGKPRAVVLVNTAERGTKVAIAFWPTHQLVVTHFWNHRTDFWDEIGRIL